jgi:hypothetical protein
MDVDDGIIRQDIDSFQRRARRDKILSGVLSDVRQESARCMGSCRNLHDRHDSSRIGNRSLSYRNLSS